VGCHADNTTDAEQKAYYKRVREGVPRVDGPLDVIALGDFNNTVDRAKDVWYKKRGGASTSGYRRPLGLAAMGDLGEHLGGWQDAFRSVWPDKTEFTRPHIINGVTVSKARIDRAMLSPHLLSGNAPCVAAVEHIWPSSSRLAALKALNTSKSAYSDHAAVQIDVRYSDTLKPARQWHLPLHLLRYAETVDHMRGIIREELAKTDVSCSEKLDAIMVRTREWAVKHVQDQSNKHMFIKRRLSQNLAKCDALLGEGLTGECTLDQITDAEQRERRIAGTRWQKTQILEELASLHGAEQRRFREDRAIDDDLHGDTCHRAFFDDTRAQHASSLVSELRDGGGRVQTEQSGLNKAATAFFGGKGGLFNLGLERDNAAEARLLQALRDDGRRVPDNLKAGLEPKSVLDPWRVQKAIAGLASNKKVGTDGFPAKFFKTFALGLSGYTMGTTPNMPGT